MPLSKGHSQKSFVKNIKTELAAGKPMKQSLAIAYAMKRKAQKAKKMAKGGKVGVNMNERGVHDQDPFAPQGQSTPGTWVREKQPEKMHPAEKEKQNARNLDLAKSRHSQNLETLKSMPKAKLQGLAEGGEVHSCPSCGYAEGGYVQGVHRSTDQGSKKYNRDAEEHGQSSMGDAIRTVTKSHSYGREAPANKSRAKELHNEMMEESSRIKPKLQGLAEGGEVHSCPSCGYAEGGETMQDSTDSPETLQARQSVSDSFKRALGHAEGGEVEDDMVDRIMHQRTGYAEEDEMYPHAKDKMFDVTNKFSEGGRVANVTPAIAGSNDNDFDDLYLRDDLRSTYGEDDNAGDSLGDQQEDEDRADLVDRIMLRDRKKSFPRGYPGR